MNDRHPSGDPGPTDTASDFSYAAYDANYEQAAYGTYGQQEAPHGHTAVYDGYSTGTFDALAASYGDGDPLFGSLPGAAENNGDGSAGAYGAGAYETGYDTGHYDTTAWTQAGYQGTPGIPAQQSGEQANYGYAASHWDTGTFDATAFGTGAYDTGQWDASQWDTGAGQPATAAYGGQDYDATGQWDTSAYAAEPYAQPEQYASYEQYPQYEQYETPQHDTPGAYDTGTFESGAFDTTGAFDAGTFDTGSYETTSFGTGTHEAYGAYAAYETHESYEHPHDPHGYGYSYDDGTGDTSHNHGHGHGHSQAASQSVPGAPEPEPDPGAAMDSTAAMPTVGAFDAYGHEHEHEHEPAGADDDAPTPAGHGDVTPLASAALPHSRGRRRSVKPRRSALLTVAVPSVAVMGVAGVAAASVMGSTGDSEDTTAQSASDASPVKPSAANDKLDTQLAGLSADADDFADRANRTQERIDLKKRQEEERKRKAEEAARKEAARPKFALPVEQHGLSARYGSAGVNWMSIHTGIDFPVSYGTPVKAATDGTVSTKWDMSYGNMAVVTAKDGTETWYCHLSSTKIRSGEVKAGETIAYSGNSGNSTGPHLHFEVRPGGGSAVDPLPWLRAKGLDPT
ncbi:M23 family metallopeptidase [Streptomyces sp. NPDC054796]